MQVQEYPNFLGGVVGIKFVGSLEYDYCLTTDEFKGIKKILGRNYLNATLEEFKQAYMVELI